MTEQIVAPVNFKPEDMFKYKSANMLFDNIRAPSRAIFSIGLARYCNFMKMTPDQIIESRKADFRKGTIDNDEELRRSHEDFFRKFQGYLGEILKPNGKKLSPNTINSNLTAVKAWYSQNYYELKHPKKFDVWNIRPLHVPTPEEVGRLIQTVETPLFKGVISAEFQSGIGTGDLLSLRWDTVSDTFGSVKEQLQRGVTVDGVVHPIIHVHEIREKTHVMFDTFMGRTTVGFLKDKDYPTDSEYVFPISARYFERIVEKASERAGLPGQTTPHCLRKAFTTQLKTATVNNAAFNNDLVEMWAGHSIGRTRGAYFKPPVIEQARLYLLAEPRVTPIFPPKPEVPA